MIAYLRGKLVHKEPTHVIVDVGGIGYQASISLNTFSDIKDREDIRDNSPTSSRKSVPPFASANTPSREEVAPV